MAIGVIVDQPVAEPEHPVKAEHTGEFRLDLIAGHRRIAIGIEQALLGGGDQSGAVAIDRAAFEDHR